MNYVYMTLENLRDHFDLDDLDALPGFSFEEYGNSIEVTAPNGALLTLTDTGKDLALYTAHSNTVDKRVIELNNLTVFGATNFIFGFIAANL